MKILVFVVSLLLFGESSFACTVSIWDIKAKSVYGRIIDPLENIIPNAVVQVYRNKDEDEEILAETKSDENGVFEIFGLKPGKYMIRSNAEGFTYSYASLKLKKSSKPRKNEEIIFTLVPHPECSGTVEIKK
jgi:hypothetical protein